MATQNTNIDNVSDIFPTTGTQTNVTPQQLPIRGEKRIIQAPVDPTQASLQFLGTKGLPLTQYHGDRTQPVEYDDFYVKSALSPYVDYVVIRLNNRGLGAN